MTGCFTLVVIDGTFLDSADSLETTLIRYDDLTWEEVVQLSELSFRQGYEVVIWRVESEEE